MRCRVGPPVLNLGEENLKKLIIVYCEFLQKKHLPPCGLDRALVEDSVSVIQFLTHCTPGTPYINITPAADYRENKLTNHFKCLVVAEKVGKRHFLITFLIF